MIDVFFAKLLERAWELFQFTRQWVSRMETHHWTVVFVIVVGIGALCMRGLGSRKHY